MALDGLVVSNIVSDLNHALIGGRIDKIAQPEKDEIILSIRNTSTNYKLLLTVEASMPRIHLTTLQKKNPMVPPNFCMFLRKHISSGKVLNITQPDFERIVKIELQKRDELGDLNSVYLIIEMMGRHSNIILINDENIILDSIKHVNSFMSSVREVLPGREYIMPPNRGKQSPLSIDTKEAFVDALTLEKTIFDSLLRSFTSMSSLIAEEICYRSNVDSSDHKDALTETDLSNLFKHFSTIYQRHDFKPTIILKDRETFKDFSSIDILHFNQLETKSYSSISELIDEYYKNKSIKSRVSQKTTDIRKLVQNNIDRCKRKLSLQQKQIEDTKDKDKYMVMGELVNANLYQIKEGDTNVTVHNYYSNEEQVIKLDPRKSPSQNAQNYYNKYNKKKRTYVALTDLIEDTKRELIHLESIQYALENATTEEDIKDIRAELMASRYIRFRKTNDKKNRYKSVPMHYISSDGFHMYVGKNNIQNEALSTKFAGNKDWWFHAKSIPGSHVIVKTEGKEVPDQVFEEAAALAAYHSKGRDNTKVVIDYTLKKNLKKPKGSAPGYFIYHTNYSLNIAPSIEGLNIIED